MNRGNHAGKEKIIIWGVGNTARVFLEKKYLYSDCEIVGFIDNNSFFWDGEKEYKGILVYSPYELGRIDYDRIIIASRFKDEIYSQLRELGVSDDKITDIETLEESVKKDIIRKYENTDDVDIKNIINYYKTNKLNIFGTYNPKPVKYEVFWEEEYPYIILEGKRMYYPKGYFRKDLTCKKYIEDVLYEQHEGSPHLYVYGKHRVKKDSVIVDAGVCEGNFALRYAETAKKIYLIENSEKWMNALERTFEPYRDKVVFCCKELSRSTTSKTITLDDLVDDEIDFLKMGIEGAEVDALLGAKAVLKRSNALCSVCCYHKKDDEENIRFIFDALGYKTDVSKGRMFFCYDRDIGETLDLRHGIVYARKE